MTDVEMKPAPENKRKRTASSATSGGGKKQKLSNVRKIGVPVNRLGSQWIENISDFDSIIVLESRRSRRTGWRSSVPSWSSSSFRSDTTSRRSKSRSESQTIQHPAARSQTRVFRSRLTLCAHSCWDSKLRTLWHCCDLRICSWRRLKWKTSLRGETISVLQSVSLALDLKAHQWLILESFFRSVGWQRWTH